MIKKLSGLISNSRLEHSVGTMEIAVKLADRYGLGKEQASLAALLHDCAREMGDEELLSIAAEEGLPVGEMEKLLPVFLHGPVGAVIARKKFGVTDSKILRAISLHTTGTSKMEMLDKIIFVADKVEPGRRYSGVEKLRELAFIDLNECLLACLDRSIEFSLEKRALLHPEICSARNGVLGEILKACP